MTFLLDQAIHLKVPPLLRDAGLEIVHTSEVGLARTDDREILAHARAAGWIIVTPDSDYHRLLVWEQAAQPSVICIREVLEPGALAALIVRVAEGYAGILGQGAALSVTSERVRFRMLPIPT